MRGELNAYGGGLDTKPEIIALSKIDPLSDDEIAEKAAALETATGKPVLRISGATGDGVRDALFRMWEQIKTDRSDEKAAKAAAEAPPDAVDEGWQP